MTVLINSTQVRTDDSSTLFNMGLLSISTSSIVSVNPYTIYQQVLSNSSLSLTDTSISFSTEIDTDNINGIGIGGFANQNPVVCMVGTTKVLVGNNKYVNAV